MNPVFLLVLAVGAGYWWYTTHTVTMLNYSITNINFSLSSFTITLTIQNPSQFDVTITTLTGTGSVNGASIGTGSVANVYVPAGQTITQNISINVGDLSALTSAISVISQGGAAVVFSGRSYIGSAQETFNVTYNV